jgi:lysophospholipase L1-like esterase
MAQAGPERPGEAHGVRGRLASVTGLLVVTLVLSVVLVEMVLRAYAAIAETALAQALRADPYAVLVEPHGDLGYRPRPGRTVRYANGTSANVNSMGFRGPTVPVPKPHGTFRVILLGGSTTFGWGVNDSETIDTHMREILAARYPNRAIEVANLAFDGYDSYQLYERFRTDGQRLEPNVLIVNTGINDARNAWFTDLDDGDERTLLYRETLEQLRAEQARGGPTLWTRVKHWFYGARVPGWLRQQLDAAAGRSAVATMGEPPFYWDAVDYFERNLRRLVDLSARSGSAVLFSTPPSSLRTRYNPTDAPRASYWVRDAQTTQVYRDSLSARMRELALEEAEKGRAVSFVSWPELGAALFLDDAHLTPRGNRELAEKFAAALEPLLSDSAAVGPR